MSDPKKQITLRWDWQKELSKSPSGRAWLGNFHHDLDSGLVTERTTKAFCDALEKREGKEVGVLLEIDGLLKHTTDYDLSGPQVAIEEDLCCIVHAFSFSRRCIAWEEIGLELDEFTEYNVIRLLGVVIKPFHYKGTLRGSRKSFFWATKSRSIIEELDKGAHNEPETDRVRDQLALSHPAGAPLLAIMIGAPAARGASAHIPLVFDAGSDVVFQSVLREATVGWTLDLSTYERGKPEVIVEAIDFDKSFKVDMLGETTRNPPELVIERLPSYQRYHEENKATKE